MTINRNLSLFAQGTFTSGGVSIGNTTDPGAKNLSVTGTGKFGTTVSVGAATPSASGAGITFPATQSASTDVNTLDDYKEGTFTPNQGAGLTVVGTFSSSASYVKIGRFVNINGSCEGSTSIAVTAVGAICSNLPFTLSGIYANGSATNGTLTASITVQVEGTTVYACGVISSTTIYWSVSYMTTT